MYILGDFHIDFFQKHPAKENFGSETVINEILNDEQLNKYFKLK